MGNELDLFDGTLTAALKRWSISLTPVQLRRLRAHFVMTVEANRMVNLTRITNPVGSAIKHYADSLAVIAWAAQRRIDVHTVLDIGTGAGFPAVPLAVMRPDWTVTAIDATRKKVEFLRNVSNTIGLNNLRAEHAHSDHWRPERKYQLVVTRATGRLGKCLGTGAGILAGRGWFVAFKTPKISGDERREADNILKKLPLRIQEPFPYELECEGKTLHRVLHVYQRVG